MRKIEKFIELIGTLFVLKRKMKVWGFDELESLIWFYWVNSVGGRILRIQVYGTSSSCEIQ